MLLPDNIHPEQCIYYNGALVLQIIQQCKSMDFLDLYVKVRDKRDISMPVFVLCLDWLYLLNLVVVNDGGKVSLCS
jgi:hypothetical protein